jgi:hypothetical protein
LNKQLATKHLEHIENQAVLETHIQALVEEKEKLGAELS